MENLEHGTNVDLLSTLAGKLAAQVLMEQYGGLTNLAQASSRQLTNGVEDPAICRDEVVRSGAHCIADICTELPCLQIERGH